MKKPRKLPTGVCEIRSAGRLLGYTAYWQDGLKQYSKYYSLRAYGDRALSLAILCRQDMEGSVRTFQTRVGASGIRCIRIYRRCGQMKGYFVNRAREGPRRVFSVYSYGSLEAAKEAAQAFLKELLRVETT